MSLGSFQEYVFSKATAIHRLLNSGPIINELAAAVTNQNVRNALLSPAARNNVFRFILKGSTAIALISDHIRSEYWLHPPTTAPLPFPFTSSSDVDFSLLVNPNLSDHDFTVIREMLIKSIVNVLYNKLRHPTDQAAIGADFARLGYTLDPTFSTVHVISHPKLSTDTQSLINFYNEPRPIDPNSYVNMRIVENNSQRNPFKTFEYSIIRLISRTKVGHIPKSVDMFDIMIPAKNYERFEFEWAYTSNSVSFNWPEPNFEFRIYGPIALYFEISHAMLENFTDEKLAAIIGEEFREKRLEKRVRWTRLLRTLKTMIHKIENLAGPRATLQMLRTFSGQTIQGVNIKTIFDGLDKPNSV
jgi:hypothetical protein